MQFLKKINTIFLFCFAILVLFNGYYFFGRIGSGPLFYVKKIFSPPTDQITLLGRYRDLSAEYQHLNLQVVNENVIVFLGDSITKRFNVHEYFLGFPVLNRGIYSDTTLGLLSRLDININNLNIDKLFLLIGYNDLQYRSNKEIVGNISTIVLRLHTKNIFVQSLLPVASDRQDINSRILEINKDLEAMCNTLPCSYIDLHSHFLYDDKGLSTEYSDDGIHPNAKGNRVWESIIEKYVSYNELK